MRSSLPIYSRDFAYTDNQPQLLVLEQDFQPVENVRAMRSGPFADLLTGSMLDFYVGAERKHWFLHRELLCHHSSFFEDENLTVLELPNHDPRGFALLVKWLYQSRLDDISGMSEDEKYEHAVSHHRLYMLCDKFDMMSVKNQAINVYRRCLREAQLVPDAKEVHEIYSSSSVNSPFRRLMVNIAARQIMDPEMEREIDSYKPCIEEHPDFAIALLKEIRRLTGGMLFDDPTAGNDCQYHDHSDGSNCQMAGHGRRRSAIKLARQKHVAAVLQSKIDSRQPTPEQERSPLQEAVEDPNEPKSDQEESTIILSDASDEPGDRMGPSPLPEIVKLDKHDPAELRTMTPSVTPARSQQRPAVSGMIKKFDGLNGSDQTKAQQRKLRMSGSSKD